MTTASCSPRRSWTTRFLEPTTCPCSRSATSRRPHRSLPVASRGWARAERSARRRRSPTRLPTPCAISACRSPRSRFVRSRSSAASRQVGSDRHEDSVMGKQDIEIARAVKLQPIQAIGETLGLNGGELEPYGSYKAKIRWDAIERASARPDGALVLVTAMTPTPAGEGKSTTTIGLADGLRRLGKRAIVAIREPSLGPVFGVKGGGTGGGHTQLAPMEDINLHFTGDMHAITAAHNLLAAMLDNHLAQGNTLGLDVRRILWKRVLDMNDRSLRRLIVGLGGPAHGVPRESGFDITVASEIMAILCLARDLQDFKARVERVIVAEKADGTLVTARELRAAGAMAVLMKDAIKPNLVQTLEATPALVHGGPFGNIAHGCNSLIATRLGLKLGEILVTEAGFASDLGAEKFVDIKCRTGGLVPSAAAKLQRYEALGYGRLPVCVAKTQNSLSDDPKRHGRPRGFTITVRDVALSAGAGFVVAYAGDILTMPGLPKVPGAEGIDIDASGNVVGLF